MSLGFTWGWTPFIVGVISTFTVKFLEDYSQLRRKNIKETFLDKWKFEDWIYIILGGLFTVAFQPINIYQAILFGAAWESLFIRIYKDIIQKTKENGA